MNAIDRWHIIGAPIHRIHQHDSRAIRLRARIHARREQHGFPLSDDSSLKKERLIAML
jgi:hypothetical protein